MAILMSWLIDAAATHIGDPHKSRVQQSQWNRIATLSLNDICSVYDVLEYEDGFDLPADGLVTYPEPCVRVSEVQVSLTPSDEATFAKLAETFEDEWNILRRGGFANGAAPTRYFADKGFVRLDATQNADVVNGGRIFYYAVPPEVVDADTYQMPLPDFLRSYLAERLVIYGLFADERDDEAKDAEIIWKGREGEIRTKIEHRAVDRRESLRPTSGRSKFARMA